MVKKVAPVPVLNTTPIANKLWEYDATTDCAFTADRTLCNRLIGELQAFVSGKYSIPVSDGYAPAWQLTVKRIHRKQVKRMLGVTKLTP